MDRVMSRILCAVLLVGTLALGGCEKKSEVTNREVRALVARMHDALRADDKETFLACFAAEDDKLAAAALFDATQATWQFDRAFKDAYGQEDFEAYVALRNFIPNVPPDEAQWAQTIIIDILNDSAVRVIDDLHAVDLLVLKQNVAWTFSWGRNRQEAAPGLAQMQYLTNMFMAGRKKIEGDEPHPLVVTFFMNGRIRLFEGKRARDPRELLETMHLALLGEDHDTFMTCFARPLDRPFARATYAVTVAAWRFEKAYILTYGPDAWEAYLTTDPLGVDVLPLDANWAAHVPIAQQDTALAVVDMGGAPPLTMAHDGDRWTLTHTAPGTPMVAAAKEAEAYRRLETVFSAAADKIVTEPPPLGVIKFFTLSRTRKVDGLLAGTPEELIQTMHLALLGRDYETFMSCYTRHVDQPIAHGVYAMTIGAWMFHSAYVGAYGEPAWREYAGAGPVRADVQPMDPKWPESVTIVRESDSLAIVEDRDGSQSLTKLECIRQGDRWTIAMAASDVPSAEAAATGEGYRRIGLALVAGAEKIRRDRPTLLQLRYFMFFQARRIHEQLNRSPKELIEAMHLALLAGDQPLFVSCFAQHTGPEVVEALYDTVQAAWRFQDAYVWAHGQEGWDAYLAGGGRRINVPPNDAQWSQNVIITREGDAVAHLVDAEHHVDLRMELQGRGGWGLTPPQVEAQPLRSLADVFNAAADMIQQDFPTPAPDAIQAFLNQHLPQPE